MPYFYIKASFLFSIMGPDAEYFEHLIPVFLNDEIP